MVDTSAVGEPLNLTAYARRVVGYPVQVGVPHVVIPVDDVDTFADAADFDAFGRAVRHDPAFPSGTNVNIISPRTDGLWRMRTYERGVERETLACGTGVVATSVVLAVLGRAQSPVNVVVSSGKVLNASFDLVDRRGVNIRLNGNATFIYDGVLDREALAEIGDV
jgi:diaminopimelate epimerase